MDKLGIIELLRACHEAYAELLERSLEIDETDIIEQLEYRYELGFIDGKIELLDAMLAGMK